MSVDIPALTGRILEQVEKIVVGKEEQTRLMITAILSQGHILLDDLPGVGKTTLVKTLSIALGCQFKRVQFTPDLLPSDVVGMNIYDQNSNAFRRMDGPVMTNLLLADEINRAIPRTQSALLPPRTPWNSSPPSASPPPRWTGSSCASPWAIPSGRRRPGCSGALGMRSPLIR